MDILKKNFLILFFGIFSLSASAGDNLFYTTKGDASLCSTKSVLGPGGHHRVLDERGLMVISQDLNKRKKRASVEFSLSKNQSESSQVELFLRKGTSYTYWFDVYKRGRKIAKKQKISFENPRGRRSLIEIALEEKLPCSCFPGRNKSETCSENNDINIIIHNGKRYKRID